MNISNIKLGDFVRTALTYFGLDVNTKRQLPDYRDGLKPVYRRVIYTELNEGVKMTKSAAIIGTTIATCHPHGDKAVAEPLSNLVRWGISTGQGNHGAKSMTGPNIDPSAPRYTEVRISDRYYRIFNEMMPYVPKVKADIKGVEPEYLPTPVPICLLFGMLGIGFGVNCRIPAFTLGSMINALYNQDPSMLEAPYDMILDKDNSDLEGLWSYGIGDVCYRYKVYKGSSDAGQGVFIEGSPELFKLNLTQLNKLQSQGKIFMIDLSSGGVGKLFIGRVSGARGISIDTIYDMAYDCAMYKKKCRLTVTDGTTSFLIPLGEWLTSTYSNYVRLVGEYKDDKIAKFRWDYQIYENLPKVVEVLYNNREYDASKISEVTGIDVSIVRAILQKSISTLRKADMEGKLSSLQSEIDYFENLVPEDKVMEILNEF